MKLQGKVIAVFACGLFAAVAIDGVSSLIPDVPPPRNLLAGPIVTARTWTDGPWPFTEDAGTVACAWVLSSPAVFFMTDDGRRWPLNTVASSSTDRFGAEPSMDPIWRPHPDWPAARVSIVPMINLGWATCNERTPDMDRAPFLRSGLEVTATERGLQ